MLTFTASLISDRNGFPATASRLSENTGIRICHAISATDRAICARVAQVSASGGTPHTMRREILVQQTKFTGRACDMFTTACNQID